MTRTSWLALLALASGMAVAAPDSPRAYAEIAAVTLAPAEALQRLALPWPVMQASRSADLADVRVFDAAGQAVPMAWAPAPTIADQQRRVPVPRFPWPETSAPHADGLQLRLGSGGAVLSVVNGPESPAQKAGEGKLWLLDLSALKDDKEHLGRIRLDWPPRANGFSAQVDAEASADGQQWSEVTRAQLLELASADQALNLKAIAWPAGSPTPRYLRLRFSTPVALSLSEVEMSRAGQAAAPPLEQLASFEPVAASGGQPGYWQLDLQGRIAPEALALQLPVINSLLRLRLEQRNSAREGWRPVSRFIAWRLQRAGRDSESPPLTLAQAAPARYWRLLPEANDVPPAPLPLAARLYWRAPQLVLLARGGNAGFHLTVGREGASPVALPLASLIPGYQAGAELALPSASLGPLSPQQAPNWRERLQDANPEDQRRWMLWGVLVAAVAGLGALAWRTIKQIAPPH